MDVEQFLSKQHMLTPEQVEDLKSNGQLPLIEEFHGTYGLEVIRAVWQSRSWGTNLELDTDNVNAYAMGKNNIATCVISTGKDSDGKAYYTYKCIESFKERGDTHHTTSTRMSGLMKNIRKRNAVVGTDIMYPIKASKVGHHIEQVTNKKSKIKDEYDIKKIEGEEYHAMLRAMATAHQGVNSTQMKSYLEHLEEFNQLESQINEATKVQNETLSKPVFVIGYNSLSESYFECVYQKVNDSAGRADEWQLSKLHKPLAEDGDCSVQIEDLPNFDKYGHILPMWAIRLKDKLTEGNDRIKNKYFFDSSWNSDEKDDLELGVSTWKRGSSYGWGDFDYCLAIFNLEENAQ